MKKEIKCEYCGGKATHDTNTNTICVCDDTSCLITYVMDECIASELSEEDHQDYGICDDCVHNNMKECDCEDENEDEDEDD